jgi:ribosome-associated protein
MQLHKKGFSMEIIKLREGDEFIKLGQALKAAGLVDSGVVAKEVIQNGQVCVNGEKDTRRGRKLYDKDSVEFGGQKIKIEK